jgi:NAD(P)-dependent dehydrogenase (short-subunit alcohol dehydrogenase family)
MSEQSTVLITGASTGFGRHTAEAFAAEGWRVYGAMRDIAGRNAGNAAELTAAGVQPVELDVTDQVSVDAAAAAILAAGPLDVLINNAGNSYMGILESYTPEAAEAQFATNVFGPLRVNRAFLPAMRERRRGLIVYVSSVVGRTTLPFTGIYAASKWALEALAETASYELRPFGIDVAIVEPAAYPTSIGSTGIGPDDPARIAGYAELVPLAQSLRSKFVASMEGREAREVGDAILRIANLPAGERPLRMLLPENPGVEAINTASAHNQRELLTAFGFESVLAAELSAR